MNSTAPVTTDGTFEGAVAEYVTLLSCYVVPLFTDGPRGRPKPQGTGFLVSSGSNSFLVSAAHVLDNHQKLFFYVKPKTKRWLLGESRLTKVPEGSTRNSDRLDVGVVKLEGPGLPPYPHVNKCALPISALLASALPRERKMYLVVGFPGTKRQPHLVHKNVPSEPFGFLGASAPAQKYAKIGVAPDRHIVISFGRKKGVGRDGKRRTAPDPTEMSGSPVWLLHAEIGTSEQSNAPVVGILIEYHESHHALVATDIAVAISMINEAV